MRGHLLSRSSAGLHASFYFTYGAFSLLIAKREEKAGEGYKEEKTNRF